jgi:hypothetical protein
MKIKIATIYLHDGVLVADKKYKIAIRAKMTQDLKNHVFRSRFFKRERCRVWLCSVRLKATHQAECLELARKCESVASGLRIRMRVNGCRPSKLRTKVVCKTLWDRILAEADKVRASNKNASRNKNRLYCKCMSVSHNMKVRLGLGKHNCATARELEKLFNDQDGKCALTGDLLEYEQYADNARCDHNVPVCRGGVSTTDNLQWVTATINAAKGKMTNEEFVEMCRKVVSHADSTMFSRDAGRVNALFR